MEQRPPTVRELRTLHAPVGWQGLPDDDGAVARGIAGFRIERLRPAGVTGGPSAHGTFHTGVPTCTREYSHVMLALARRVQPWL